MNEADLTCPICDEPFIDPVSLNCGSYAHTFCRACLDKHINITHANETKFNCPNCRHEFQKNAFNVWDLPTQISLERMFLSPTYISISQLEVSV